MEAHANDASLHFTGMATKLSDLIVQVTYLKNKIVDLKEIVFNLEAEIL
jgi:hypothetical protein